MNILHSIAALALLGALTASAAPGDAIDPRTIKEKVSLTLGTKGTIQFKQDGNTLTGATLAKDAGEKKPGIEVEFSKEEKILVLMLTNRLPKALNYRAAIRLKGRKNFVETSLIVPVDSGLVSAESWGDPIEELILFDFKLTDEKK